MRITSTRLATEADAKAIAELVNNHELSVDSKSSLMSEQGALNFIAGYVDPSVTHLISINDEPGFSAVVNLHPDALKSRYFADVYADPKLGNLDSVVLWAINLAKSEHDDWDMWPGVNYLDKRLQSAWTNHGFEFLRRYYTMRMNQPTVSTIREIEDLEIRAIDIANPDEVALWHKVHQNSFSKHFGFAPRDLEKWRNLVLNDVSLDPNGVFLAFKNGEPIGFCECNDEFAEENKGFIAGLGVTQENQGLGIGEALLQTGIVYSASKGYDTVELNVDTGNESGALKLYEKVGFKAESSWIQLHRPRAK
jgi:ribosomal protein S18 acetylase RimI-like enzyme